MIPMKIKFLEPDDHFMTDGTFFPNAEITLGVSPHGLASGRPSVLIKIEFNGETVVVPTTGRLFAAMGRLIVARYPDLFEGE